MGPVIYFLDALISLVCCALLWRGYSRSKNQLLFWSAICFFGLGCSNGLLFIDLVIFPESVSLFTWRLALTALSLLCLLFGLVWERE